MPFDYQPVLQGELVAVRPLRADDHDALYAIAADPLIWEQHPHKTRSDPTGFRTFFREALASGGALVVIDQETQHLIGSSRFHAYHANREEVEIVWTFLARSHWGGRYNRELKQLMLRHAFRFVRRVVFLIAPGNIRSQRAVERIGGVRVGNRRNGEGRESFVFAIAAPDSRVRGGA